jgi:hypothetical protein
VDEEYKQIMIAINQAVTAFRSTTGHTPSHIALGTIPYRILHVAAQRYKSVSVGPPVDERVYGCTVVRVLAPLLLMVGDAADILPMADNPRLR